MFKYALAAVAAIFMTSAANAGTVSVEKYTNSSTEYIHYTGTVEKGDLYKLKSAYDRLMRQSGRNYVTIIMDSPGGSGHEMKEIVKWMKNKQIHTRVAKDDNCYSACAVIWTHGKFRTWDNIGNSVIGYHIGSISNGEALANYIRDHGVMGVQNLIQYRAADDLLYYSYMPVKDPLNFTRNIARNGYAGYTFWKPTYTVLSNIVGFKNPTVKEMNETVAPAPSTGSSSSSGEIIKDWNYHNQVHGVTARTVFENGKWKTTVAFYVNKRQFKKNQASVALFSNPYKSGKLLVDNDAYGADQYSHIYSNISKGTTSNIIIVYSRVKPKYIAIFDGKDGNAASFVHVKAI